MWLVYSLAEVKGDIALVDMKRAEVLCGCITGRTLGVTLLLCIAYDIVVSALAASNDLVAVA